MTTDADKIRGTMKTFTRPGFDRDDLPVLSSIALSGPGRVNNDLGTRRGFSMGSKPNRFGTPEERFWRKVNKDGPVPDYRTDLGRCWLWTAGVSGDGYGKFWDGRCMVWAHRFAYELLVGLAPEGLQVDHLCRVRACVNADHMELVTTQVNTQRGEGSMWQREKTHCPQGHPYDMENTHLYKGWRFCRACHRRSQQIFYAKKHSS